MKQLSLSRMVAVACILCASSAGASAAQHGKHGNDPARWYNGDSTQHQRMNVLKKELNAAYAEQTAACKKTSSAKRSSCMKQARANFARDSANARQLVANAPKSEITERVVSVTPAAGQDRMQGGDSAYGRSGAAGQTGAGASPSMSGGQQSDARQSGAEQSGAAGYGSSQSMGSPTPPVQSGPGASQSMGAGTGATQSDTQDQPRAGAVPPVQR